MLRPRPHGENRDLVSLTLGFATTPVTLKSAVDTVNSNQYFTLEFKLHLRFAWQTHLLAAERLVGA